VVRCRARRPPPMLLSFTDPTFVDGFELHGNVCGRG
jgi:hypothetical protein